MSYAFQAEGLVKRFGKTTALAGLDLAVRTGEVHGFLGPNGAGKTTTIRILLGLLRADAGAVSLLGGDPWRDVTELHRRLAYVPGDVSLWPTLSGGEIIDLLGRLRGGLDQRRRADLLDGFELDPRKKARAYSKGNRQKVGLVAALASNVELLLLDEPTSGLDPLMEEVFQDCIAEVRQEGRTVLLASHILAEVEKLCDRLSIIRDGRIVETGTLSELRLLVMALDANGRQAEALTAYEEFRRLLADELGADPGPELQRAHLAVLKGDRGAQRPSGGRRRGNLRAALTSFVGRAEEQALIERRLLDGRLVTLVGAGGVRKTRLATTLAAELIDAFPGGVWLVELAPVTDPGLVAQALVGALGLRETGLPDAPATSGDPMSRLVEALSATETVIVLDSCEHLLDAAARLAEDLLGRCSRLRILATSLKASGGRSRR